jgi:hypothetical protein
LDTAIIVGVVIGSVVAMVLVFAKTVLGVAWTGKSTRSLKAGTSQNKIQNRLEQEYSADINSSETELRLNQIPNQRSTDEQKAAIVDSLIDKQVSTCDNATIGNVHSVHNGMIVIIHNESSPQQNRYEIPTYYIRQNYENCVVLDICANDLGHYIPQIAY